MATMAGGMKVAVLPAVGSGPWSWRSGGCGAVWLLLVLSGCLVCGSGTARAAAAEGAGAEGLYLEKWGVSAGRWPFFCRGGKDVVQRKKIFILGEWAPSLRGRGPEAAWGSYLEWGEAWSLLAETGRPELSENWSWGCVALCGPP